MHPILIAIDAYGPWLAFQLMENTSVEPGISHDIGHKATLTLTDIASRVGAGYTNTLTFRLAFPRVPPDGATLGYVAGWLHHKLHRRAKEFVMRINSAEVPVDKRTIQAALADAFHGLLDTAS